MAVKIEELIGSPRKMAGEPATFRSMQQIADEEADRALEALELRVAQLPEMPESRILGLPSSEEILKGAPPAQGLAGTTEQFQQFVREPFPVPSVAPPLMVQDTTPIITAPGSAISATPATEGGGGVFMPPVLSPATPQVPPGPALTMRDVGEQIVGAGEVGLQIGTGALGMLRGAGHFAQGVLSRLAAGLPTAENIERAIQNLPRFEDPNYWKNLKEKSQQLAAEVTYEPRTRAGRAQSEALAPALDALHQLSVRASQAPLARMLLTEDQRHLLEYVHETVLMGLAGEVALGRLGRGKVKKFQDELQRNAAPPAVPGTAGVERRTLPTPELLRAAQDIADVVTKSPEIANVVGKARMPFEPDKVTVGYFTDPSVAPADKLFMMDQVLARRGGRAEAPVVEESVGWFRDPRIADDTKQQVLSKILEERRQTSPPLPEAAVPTALQETAMELSPTPALRATRRQRDYAKMHEGITERERLEFTEGLTETRRAQREAQRLSAEGMTVAQIRATLRDDFDTIPDKSLNDILRRVQKREETPAAPDYVREAMRQYTELSDRMGLTPDIIRLAKAGNTAGQIRHELGDRIKAVPLTDRVSLIRAVREREGIPSLDEIARGTVSADDLKIERAQEQARMFTSKPELLQAIQQSLESGTDISAAIKREVPGMVNADIAEMRYRKLQELARKGIKGSEHRGVAEILNDIVELFAFDIDPSSLGSMMANISLSHRQRTAAQRLLADAKRSGRDLNQLIDASVEDPAIRMTYKTYLGSISDAINPPANMPKDMPITGNAEAFPVKRRVNTAGRNAMPVYNDDAQLVIAAPLSEPATRMTSLEVPIRGARRYGIEEITTRPYRQIITDIDKEVRALNKDVDNLRKVVGYSGRKNISDYALNARGVLTESEQRVLNTIEVSGGATLDRINMMREAIGNEPIPDTYDIIPFMRNIIAKRDQGISTNLVSAPLTDIIDKTQTPQNFPRTLTQYALRQSGEKDLLRIYTDFTANAIEDIRMTPFTAKLRELIDYNIPDTSRPVAAQPGAAMPQAFEQWRMAVDNPGLYKFLDGWVSELEGKSNFPLALDPLFRKINNNLAFSLLAFSMSSAAAQPFALVQTLHRTGAINVAKALGTEFQDIKNYLMGKETQRSIDLSESKILSARNSNHLYGNWTESTNGRAMIKAIEDFREGRTRELVQDVARFGLGPLEALDIEGALVTYRAAKLHGHSQGLRGEALVRYADDIVIETQGSGWRGDLAPIQRNAFGKMITQFQTFGINEFNTIVNDVLKVNKNASSKEIAISIARFAGIVAVANTVADFFHIGSPLPNPYKAWNDNYEKTGDPFAAAANAFFETVGPYTPVLGSSRYGKGIGGPFIAKAFTEVPSALQAGPMSKSVYKPIIEIGGVPAASTIWKLQQDDDKRNLWESLMNWQPPRSLRATGTQRTRRGRTE